MNQLKYISQDNNGQYLHKAIFKHKDGMVLIATTPIFPDAGGCWTCMGEIHFFDKTFKLEGVHERQGVIMYKEVA